MMATPSPYVSLLRWCLEIWVLESWAFWTREECVTPPKTCHTGRLPQPQRFRPQTRFWDPTDLKSQSAFLAYGFLKRQGDAWCRISPLPGFHWRSTHLVGSFSAPYHTLMRPSWAHQTWNNLANFSAWVGKGTEGRCVSRSNQRRCTP